MLNYYDLRCVFITAKIIISKLLYHLVSVAIWWREYSTINCLVPEEWKRPLYQS